MNRRILRAYQILPDTYRGLDAEFQITIITILKDILNGNSAFILIRIDPFGIDVTYG